MTSTVSSFPDNQAPLGKGGQDGGHLIGDRVRPEMRDHDRTRSPGVTATRSTWRSAPAPRSYAPCSPTLVADADLLLTAETRHRENVLEEWPAAVRRTFTLQQFADLADASPDLDARALLAEAQRTRRPARASGDVLGVLPVPVATGRVPTLTNAHSITDSEPRGPIGGIECAFLVHLLGRPRHRSRPRDAAGAASEEVGGQCGTPGATEVHSRSMGMTWRRSA